MSAARRKGKWIGGTPCSATTSTRKVGVNHAELAQLGQVSRTRVRQILMLANLAPAIQEALLFLPKTVRGPDRITENRLRDIAGLVDWEAQIQVFRSWLGRLT